MTILATKALLRDALEARAASIVVRARLGQDNELLSLPCLGLAGEAAAIWRDLARLAGCSYARDTFTRFVFYSGIRVARLLHALCRQHQPQCL